MIRVLVVDDHPAVVAGLQAVLRAEPGIVPVGAAASAEEAHAAVDRLSPDVALVDYHLPGEDGLALCLALTRGRGLPRVAVYSAYAGPGLVIPALLAGASAILSKAAPASDLYDVIRRVARGDRLIPPPSRELLDEATGQLRDADLPVLGMALDGTPAAEIAAVLGVERGEIDTRIGRMIRRLAILPAQPPAS